MIECRVRDHCWHACSVIGEGKYKKADSKTLYEHRVFTRSVRAEPVEGSSSRLVSTTSHPDHIYTKPHLANDSTVWRWPSIPNTVQTVGKLGGIFE